MSKQREKTERKRNFVIYSMNGGIFTADKAMNSDKGISEEEILKEVFKGNDLDEISYTRITNSSFKDLSTMPEDIRIYFNSSKDQVWNYNPIISVFMGTMIYSNVIVFVSDKEMEENYPEDPSDIMPNDMFLTIVSKFISVCTEYAYKAIEDNQLDAEDNSISEDQDRGHGEKRSPMFQLSKIAYKTCITEDDICVKPKRDLSGLDDHWKKNYVGKYSPDFVINDLLVIDDDTGQYSNCHLMMNPGIMTLYLLSVGKAEVYFTQTTFSMYNNIAKKMEESVDDLGKDPSKEDIKKAKEKILLKTLYN